MEEKKYYRITSETGRMIKEEIRVDCKEININKIKFIIFEEYIQKYKDWFGKYVIVHLETGHMAGHGNSKKSAIAETKEKLTEYPEAIKITKEILIKGKFELPINKN